MRTYELRPSGGSENPLANDAEWINPAGFRDYVYPTEKPGGTVRVGMIGDSFMYGNGIPFNVIVPKQVEALLQKRFLPCNVEVMNFAVPGMKLDAYPSWIKTKIAPYQVDWIVFELAPQTLPAGPIVTLPHTKLQIAFAPFISFLNCVLPDRGDVSRHRKDMNAYLAGPGSEILQRLLKLKHEAESLNARCAGIVWPLKIRRYGKLFGVVRDQSLDLLATAGIPPVEIWSRYERYRQSELMVSMLDPHPSALADSLVSQAVVEFFTNFDLCREKSDSSPSSRSETDSASASRD